jgi:hypothetical protein
MYMYLQLSMQSVPITTDIVSSNFDQGEVYSLKDNVEKKRHCQKFSRQFGIHV